MCKPQEMTNHRQKMKNIENLQLKFKNTISPRRAEGYENVMETMRLIIWPNPLTKRI